LSGKETTRLVVVYVFGLTVVPSYKLLPRYFQTAKVSLIIKIKAVFRQHSQQQQTRSKV
jgi:hypothetical protein